MKYKIWKFKISILEDQFTSSKINRSSRLQPFVACICLVHCIIKVILEMQTFTFHCCSAS